MTPVEWLKAGNPSKAPKRKRSREEREYFESVALKASEFRMEPGDGAWWDHWHYHADWPGYGNIGWRCRLEHIKAHCAVYETIAEGMQSWSGPFQTWIQLWLSDAGQDAVYVHSPNGNGSPFPAGLPDVDWGDDELGDLVRPYLAPGRALRAGAAIGSKEEPYCAIVYSPDVGTPLE